MPIGLIEILIQTNRIRGTRFTEDHFLSFPYKTRSKGVRDGLMGIEVLLITLYVMLITCPFIHTRSFEFTIHKPNFRGRYVRKFQVLIRGFVDKVVAGIAILLVTIKNGCIQ